MMLSRLAVSPSKQNGNTTMARLTEHPSEDPGDVSLLLRRRAPRVGVVGAPGRTCTPAEKLAARIIRQPNGCWDVQGWRLPHSGHVQINRTAEGLPVIRAHRLAWELAFGPVPDGMKVLHRCDNSRCANPSHLFLGSQADNVNDCVRKGRRNAFGRQKLQLAQVREIRMLAETGLRFGAIALRYGVARRTVRDIVNLKTWIEQEQETAQPIGVLTQLPARVVNLGHHPLDRVFERVPSVELSVRGEVG